MTVLEILQLSSDYLGKKGIESARLNAELLLANILYCKRLDLYLSFDRPLNINEINAYRELLKRRAAFEPLQYILGEVEFYGIPFQVKPPVLIPRQETEILIETICKTLDSQSEYTFLDIGTGSGNIAVCIAKHFPKAKIISVDKNESAVALAEKNAQKNSVSEKISFRNLDILTEKFNLTGVDVIVSNPPYVSLAEYSTLQKEIVNYEAADAITDYKDGFSFYKNIIESTPLVRENKLHLFFEMGKGQSDLIKEMLVAKGFGNIQITKDYLNIDRVIYGEIN